MKKKISLLVVCGCLFLVAKAVPPAYSFHYSRTTSSSNNAGWTGNISSQTTEERQVGDFDRIGVSGPFYVTLESGTPGSLRIESGSKIREKIITKVVDGQLIIKFKNEAFRSIRYSRINITIPVNSINSLKLSGSGSINSNFRIAANSLHTSLSGSGKISVDVATEELTAKLSGSGKMVLKGDTEKTKIYLSGSGRVAAFDLKSQEANVQISGSGRIEVYAQEMISSHISGSGIVKYKSDNEKPRLNSTVNGSGRLTRGK